MQAAGEQSWTNASHLVIVNDDHPQAGQYLTAALLNGGDDSVMVIDRAGELAPAPTCPAATLRVTRALTLLDGTQVTVKSAFQLLKESADALSLDAYSRQCGVPVARIEQLADAFTRHGRKAAVITHGGMMSGNGFYNAWAVMMLNALIGNLSL